MKLSNVSFLIKDGKLLEKYKEILGKFEKSLKKEFATEPMYNKKYLKAKIKSYNGKINTNFHDNKIQKEDSQFLSLSVILIDSVFRAGKNYHLQVFLEGNMLLKKRRFLSILLRGGFKGWHGELVPSLFLQSLAFLQSL